MALDWARWQCGNARWIGIVRLGVIFGACLLEMGCSSNPPESPEEAASRPQESKEKGQGLSRALGGKVPDAVIDAPRPSIRGLEGYASYMAPYRYRSGTEAGVTSPGMYYWTPEELESHFNPLSQRRGVRGNGKEANWCFVLIVKSFTSEERRFVVDPVTADQFNQVFKENGLSMDMVDWIATRRK